MIKTHLPILVCNICGKEVQTASHSQNYKMRHFTLADYFQHGTGSSAYQLDDQRTGDCCNECLSTMAEESPKFKAFINSMKLGR